MLTNAGRLIVTGLLLALTVLAIPLFAEPLAPFEFSIKNIPNARIGDNIEITVKYLSGSEQFGRLKFIVAYDPGQLKVLQVSRGAIPTICDWDVFSYTVDSCNACDWATIEINGTADDSTIAGASSCLSPFGDYARIRFQIRPDTLIAGEHADINFYWVDCTSNTLVSPAADTVWHGRFAYDALGNEITGSDSHLGGTLPGCIAPGEVVPIRAINTTNGGVQINTSWGVYGDANGDGRFNLSDITYMINYMFAGGSAPKDYLHGDYDGNGRVDISDAVFLFNYLFFLLYGG